MFRYLSVVAVFHAAWPVLAAFLQPDGEVHQAAGSLQSGCRPSCDTVSGCVAGVFHGLANCGVKTVADVKSWNKYVATRARDHSWISTSATRAAAAQYRIDQLHLGQDSLVGLGDFRQQVLNALLPHWEESSSARPTNTGLCHPYDYAWHLVGEQSLSQAEIHDPAEGPSNRPSVPIADQVLREYEHRLVDAIYSRGEEVHKTFVWGWWDHQILHREFQVPGKRMFFHGDPAVPAPGPGPLFYSNYLAETAPAPGLLEEVATYTAELTLRHHGDLDDYQKPFSSGGSGCPLGTVFRMPLPEDDCCWGGGNDEWESTGGQVFASILPPNDFPEPHDGHKYLFTRSVENTVLLFKNFRKNKKNCPQHSGPPVPGEPVALEAVQRRSLVRGAECCQCFAGLRALVRDASKRLEKRSPSSVLPGRTILQSRFTFYRKRTEEEQRRRDEQECTIM